MTSAEMSGPIGQPPAAVLVATAALRSRAAIGSGIAARQPMDHHVREGKIP